MYFTHEKKNYDVLRRLHSLSHVHIVTYCICCAMVVTIYIVTYCIIMYLVAANFLLLTCIELQSVILLVLILYIILFIFPQILTGNCLQCAMELLQHCMEQIKRLKNNSRMTWKYLQYGMELTTIWHGTIYNMTWNY